nr:DNA polymerase III subunit gamma and tau [Brevibacterium marinum]
MYRRYRPETFDEVIGQEHVTDPLKAAIDRGRINHAYLFSGPRGCGKTTSARILARCLNCEKGPTPVPCGECPSCQDLASGGPGSLDVVEIDAASHNGVDDARDLRERAIYAPARDRYKVFILDEAHMVTSQGFNALLKIVEEPPPHIKFVFATTEPEKVIGTIRSRTHHYPFRLVPPEALGNYMEGLCEREGVHVAKGVLPLVVRAGGGSVRDTLSVLDQLIAGSGPDGVDYAGAIALLGYTPDSLLSDIVDAFSAGDGGGVYRAVERVIESGQDPRRFVEDLLERMRDLIVINAAPEAAHAFLPEVPPDRLERLTLQARGFGQGELSRAADLLNQGLTEMSGATSPRLQLELICARILLPGSGRSRDAVLSRVERMERRIGMSAAGTAANLPPAPQEESSQPGSAPVETGQPAQRPEPRTAQSANADSQSSTAAAQSSSAGTQPSSTGTQSSSASAQSTSAAAHDDFDDLAEMAAAAESMLNEPPRSNPVEGGREEASPSSQSVPETSQRESEPPQSESGLPQRDSGLPQREPEPSLSHSEPRAAAPTPPQAPTNDAALQRDRPSGGDKPPESDKRPEDDRTPESEAAPESDSVAGAGNIGGEIEAIRRAWPSILAAVEKRSRLTRAIIAANAIPQSFSDGVVYLGFNNAGSVHGFQQRDHAAKLAMAINDVLGIQARIDIGDVGRFAGNSGQGGTSQGVAGQGSAGQGSVGQGSPGRGSGGKGSSAQAGRDADGGYGPPPEQRRPSPQEVAAVVGTREVDKPQVDHEKFWERNGSPQGPWSDDDEEGEPPTANDAPQSTSEPEPSPRDPEQPPNPGSDGASAPAEGGTASEPANGGEVTSDIVVPDLSDDDFFGSSDDGEADPAAEASTQGGSEAPMESPETPMEYVQPRWEEPTWHDAPTEEAPNHEDFSVEEPQAVDPDEESTSAGSGAVDVGAVVVPPPEDDDLGDGADADTGFPQYRPQTSPESSSPPEQAPSSRPQGNAGAKPFKSRFAALAEKHGGSAAAPPVRTADLDAVESGAGAQPPTPGPQPPNPGADEDEYDPETDLDVSEAPQFGVAVIAEVLGGEIIDEREV